MEEVKPKGKRKVSPKSKYKRFSVEQRLQAVKMVLEDKLPRDTVCRESGFSETSLNRWIGLYRKEGAAGLATRPHPRTGRGLPAAVRDQMITLRKTQPEWGVRRISNILHRMFFLPGGRESVRTTLKDAGMNNPPRKKRQRNITRPRFFERTTPNQMWQTDIFTFRMGGRYWYLIGFIDDYSRFMVGLGLYMSQTAQNVIEVYRRATTEYAVPKEMLTDNGRQYTTWRGTSKFEQELQKDKIHHIKSQPHHPMTLGKIERFWKTIYGEFLVRAQFGSFEDAQQRVKLWVQYYNFRRPHQGIEGLCPADRYFEIQSQVRKTIETGIADNLLELALRGKPKNPFYLIGRMDGQSVVLRAEKGKLKVTVDDLESTELKETEYDIPTGGNDGQGEAGEERGETAGGTEEETAVQPSLDSAHGAAEERGGSGRVDGTAQPLTGVPGDGNNLDYIKPVAGEGAGGDATGSGAAGGSGQGTCAEPAAAVPAAQETGVVHGAQPCTAAEGSAVAQGTGFDAGHNGGVRDGNATVDTGDAAGGGDPAGAQRGDQRKRGSEAPGRIAQDLLRVGTPWVVGHDGCGGEWGRRPAVHRTAGGSRDSGAAQPGGVTGEGSGDGQADGRGAQGAGALRTAAAVAAG